MYVRNYLIPAYTCRLHCTPGYVSPKTPLVTCINGRYQPDRPSKFSCQPAVALIVTTKGEVEVFSPEGSCNQILTSSLSFTTTGHSIDLLVDQLILVGYEKEGDSWNYITFPDPRGGLLASKVSISSSKLGKGAPRHHTSFVHGHSLYLLGGDHATQAKLEKGVWNNIDIKWRDGRIFSSSITGSCSVTISKEVFMVLGGFEGPERTEELLSSVTAINVRQLTAEEYPPLKHARAFHSCQVLQDGRILVSGGARTLPVPVPGTMVPDELYDPTLSRARQVLAFVSSLLRYQHRLVRLGTTVFALGGIDGTLSELTSVKQFHPATNTWSEHPRDLLSSSTSGIAVTAFPRSAVDCVQECR